MMSLKALALILAAILLHTCSRKVHERLFQHVSSRQGYLRKQPFSTASKTEKLSLNHGRIYLGGHDGQRTKQRILQEKNPVTQGFYRMRVWLEVGYHKMPPELGIVLLIIVLVLVSACAACCCVTPFFYAYDHWLHHHRHSVSEEAIDSKVVDDSRTVKSDENGGENCKVPLEIYARV